MQTVKNAKQSLSDKDKAIEKALAAHGGVNKWLAADQLIAKVSVGGLNYMRHFRFESFSDITAQVDTKTFAISLSPFLKQGQVGVFEKTRLRIETDAGEVLRERPNTNGWFSKLCRNFYFDDLDLLYALAQQVWSATMLPFVLAAEGVKTELLPSQHDGMAKLTRLQVELPEDMPSAGTRQVYGFDATGLLKRVEYTSRVRPWDSVVHLCDHHESFNGFIYPTTRRIYPQAIAGMPLRMLTVGWIDVEDVSVA